MSKKKIYLLFMILFIVLVYSVYRKLSSTPIIPSTVRSNVPIRNSQDTRSISDKLKNKIPFNILLLGYGGGTHDGAYLTDSMMIAHVDPSSKAAVLLSIPRDLWVNIPTNKSGGSNWKINAAYAVGLDDKKFPDKPDEYKETNNGAGNLVKTTVQFVIGLHIDRFIAADFSSFSNAIDALGGLDVQIDKTFDDFAYPIDGKETDPCITPSVTPTPIVGQVPQDFLPTIFPCRYEHFHVDSGSVHLDGQTALKFVRSRHSSDNSGDFGRSNRQRIVMTSLKKKLFSLSVIPKIIPLYISLKNSIDTDISLDEMKSLLLSSNEISQYEVKSIPISDQNVLSFSYSQDGQYILAPKTGIDDWNGVHHWLQSQIQKALSPSRVPNNK